MGPLYKTSLYDYFQEWVGSATPPPSEELQRRTSSADDAVADRNVFKIFLLRKETFAVMSVDSVQ